MSARTYVPDAALAERVKSDFTYQAPRPDQVERYGELRSAAHEFAELVLRNTPLSAEQLTALGKISEAVMWANAAIARNEPAPPAAAGG